MRLERRHALWLPIVLLHAWLWVAHLPRQKPDRPSPRGSLTVRLIPSPSSVKHLSAPPVRPPLRRPPLSPNAARLLDRADTPPAPTGTQPSAPATPQAEATAPAPPPGSLLHTEATRRAIHLATRAPLLSERATSASDAPDRENAQQRFGREVARSAYGNCLKGEFPGAGGGLLSLPMFLIAEASGRCQK